MTLVIVQARLSSNRFPGKVLKKINGHPMIYWQLKRISKANLVSNIVVATSLSSSDDSLVEYCNSIDQIVERGSLNNVKARFDKILRKYPCDYFVRLTADCPLVMPEVIDNLIRKFRGSNLDYLSNTISPTFPDGLDVEVVRTSSFINLNSKSLSKVEKEHVTYAMYSRKGQFSVENYSLKSDLSHLRWTVDYKEDFDFICKVYHYFKGRESEFTLDDMLNLIAAEPSLKSRISANRRNESLYKMLSPVN